MRCAGYDYKIVDTQGPHPANIKEYNMKTQPLKGMRDLLPREQALRDYIQGQILATYRAAGFQRIFPVFFISCFNLRN